MRRALRLGLRLLGALAAIPVLYLLAALVLGTIPANRDWEEPKEGVTLFVRTNGVHTWIVVPAVSPEMDWRTFAPAEHLKDPNWGRASHVALGYGNRTFYLETPTWGDLSMKNAFLAAFGQGRSLVHVDYTHNPQADEVTKPIRVTREQYGLLAKHIAASFQRGPDGKTMPVLGRGYTSSDMFYEGVGPYSALYTCNAWSGEALRSAGVKMGIWTPLSQSLMWRVD